uniref:Uncharacterized protein AlNc14C247G9581 n=1 Tax=Albugo laibachii Nc14 TaxID=890382 RepID=F0WT96_9STRA|nr:conserved hypothetical protein [Albugo laibachii Nc14]|eukprot:CCA24585.1 conserved hypothetical protein [Albugo laibachii Nc14]
MVQSLIMKQGMLERKKLVLPGSMLRKDQSGTNDIDRSDKLSKRRRLTHKKTRLESTIVQSKPLIIGKSKLDVRNPLPPIGQQWNPDLDIVGRIVDEALSESRDMHVNTFSGTNQENEAEKAIQVEASATDPHLLSIRQEPSDRTEVHVPHQNLENPPTTRTDWAVRKNEKILGRNVFVLERSVSMKSWQQYLSRQERLQMTLKDVNTSNVHVSTLNISAGKRVIASKKYRKLTEIQMIVQSRQEHAEHQVHRTMDGIRRWIPFNAMIQHSQREFTSLKGRNAIKFVSSTLEKRHRRHIAEAFRRWNDFSISKKEEEQLTAASLLQGWVKCVLAKIELRRLQLARQRSHLRKTMLHDIRLSKEIKSVRIITYILAKHVYQVRHNRARLRSAAAKRIGQSIIKYKSHCRLKNSDLTKEETETAAVTSTLDSKSDPKSRLLQQKLARVDLHLKEKSTQSASHRLGFTQVGAALLLQNTFRPMICKKSHGAGIRYANFMLAEKKALRIQALIRGTLARLHVDSYRLRCQLATKILQRSGHLWVARIQVLRLRNDRDRDRGLRRQNCSICNGKKALKAKNRGPLNLILSYLPFNSQKFSVKIQSTWRGYRTRKQVRCLRARKCEMSRRKVFRKKKIAAIKIQKNVRGMQGRYQIWYTIMCKSAMCIQRRWCRFLARKKIRALRRIQYALRRFRLRRRKLKVEELIRETVTSGNRIIKFSQSCLHKIAARRHISNQQRLREIHTLGHIQYKSLSDRVGDELLIHSFTCGLYDTSGFAKHHLTRANAQTPLIDRDMLTGPETQKFANPSVQRSLFECMKEEYLVETTTISRYRWQRKPYHGIWQQLFVYICGYEGAGIPQCEVSRSVSFLKALSKEFINKQTFSVERVESIFYEICDRQTTTMNYNQFTTSMMAALKQKFTDENDERKLFLRFMHHYVLPSPLEYGRFNKAQRFMTRERILWGHRILRRFTFSTIRHKNLVDFKKRFYEHRAAAFLQSNARMIQKWFRCRVYKIEMRTKWAEMFVRYVDQESNRSRWKHITTGTELVSIPLVLHGQECRKVIPNPLRGDVFHPMCFRHEGNMEDENTVAAQVYCLQCEDVMCKACFRRDHGTRIAFNHHQPKMLKLCCNCENQIATRECLICADGKTSFCDTCFCFLHTSLKSAHEGAENRSDTKQKHPFRGYVVMCVECGERTGQWKCDDCDDLYCKRCLTVSHGKLYRLDHSVHQVNYVAVIASQNLADRKGKVKEKELIYQKKLSRLHEVAKYRERKQNLAATCIQAAIRTFLTRKRAKLYRRLINRTIVAKRNRLSDERIRTSLIYKIRYTFGLASLLKSDTQKERETQQTRFSRLYRTIIPCTKPKLQVESESLRELSPEEETHIRSSLPTWCVYGEQVTILGGPWRGERGSIVSTRNLLSTGSIQVFMTMVNRCVVCDWANVRPHCFEEELLRQPFATPLSRFLGLAAESQQRLEQSVKGHIRRTKLMYLQTIEYSDISQYAWVSVLNCREKREEFWNVVTNARSLSQPASMEKIQRMELWQRNMIELRVQAARARIEFLLDSTAKQEKYALKMRRNAFIIDPIALNQLSASLTSMEVEGSSTNHIKWLNIESEAIACARFWKQRVVENEFCGNVKRIRNFEELCADNCILCWTLVRLWRYIDSQNSKSFEALAAKFFTIAPRFQLYIIQTMIKDLVQGSFTTAKESFIDLLNLENETLHVLVTQKQDAAASPPLVIT